MKRRGFTYIELVTVWGIMGILAAILFPVFAKAREKGWQTSCLSNLANIGAGLRVYAADNWGHFPPTDNNLEPLLARCVPDPATFVCPSVRNIAPFSYPRVIPHTRQQGLGSLDYVYRGGLCDDDQPQNLVAGDLYDDIHNHGANYLWLDGHAKWLVANYKPTGEYAAAMPGYEELQKLRKQRTGKISVKPEKLPAGGKK